jgi:hypothetical protein
VSDGAPPGGDPEHARGGWLELARNRRFLLLEASGALGGAGYAVYSVSVLFLTYGLTGNLLVTGLVLFIEYGVYTGTFLVAPLVDRAANKRTVLLVCYPLMAAAALWLAFSLRRGTIPIPLLLGLVLVLSVLWDFVWAVYMIAPRLVVEKRQLLLATGLASTFAIGTQVGGYAVGGALLFLVGPSGGATAYCALLAAAAFASLPLSLPVEGVEREPFGAMFLRGWESFRGRAGAALRRFSGLEIVYGFASGLPLLLLPAIAHEGTENASAVYALLVTSYTIGGAAAGVVLGHFNPRRWVGALIVGCPWLAAACLLALARAPTAVSALAAIVAALGAAISVRYDVKYAWVRASFPPELLGRIISNLYLFTGFASAIAVVVVGSLSARLPLASLELLTAIVFVAAGSLALFLPFVRRLAY